MVIITITVFDHLCRYIMACSRWRISRSISGSNQSKKKCKLELGVRQVKMSAKFSPYFPMDISATANFHNMRGDKISKDDFFWLIFLGQWFFCCSSQKFLFNSIFCVSNTVCVGGFQGWKTSSFLWNSTSKNGIKAYDGNCNGFVAYSSSTNQSCKSRKTIENQIPRTQYHLMRFCGAIHVFRVCLYCSLN